MIISTFLWSFKALKVTCSHLWTAKWLQVAQSTLQPQKAGTISELVFCDERVYCVFPVFVCRQMLADLWCVTASCRESCPFLPTASWMETPLFMPACAATSAGSAASWAATKLSKSHSQAHIKTDIQSVLILILFRASCITYMCSVIPFCKHKVRKWIKMCMRILCISFLSTSALTFLFLSIASHL